jgi:endonuclease III
MPVRKRLQKIVEILAKRYEVDGRKVELTDLRDPFQLGAWRILGRRSKRNGQARAYDALRRAKGLSPGALLDIAPEKLASVCEAAGPYEDARATELYQYADTIEEKWGQDFGKLFKKPAAEVHKFLENELRQPRDFTDLLLLYGAGQLVFPVEARVARVAARLGFVKLSQEKELDEKTYKAIQKKLESETPRNRDGMVRTHSVLYRHGTDLCHATAPACAQCPLQAECQYLKKHPLPVADGQ